LQTAEGKGRPGVISSSRTTPIRVRHGGWRGRHTDACWLPSIERPRRRERRPRFADGVAKMKENWKNAGAEGKAAAQGRQGRAPRGFGQGRSGQAHLSKITERRISWSKRAFVYRGDGWAYDIG